jgi:glycosyltransferase involved in cell wall biosynthesis
MRVWFHARGATPFAPGSIATQQIGGSESALYHVARGLAALGHEVVVLSHCGSGAGLYDGVRYYDVASHAAQWRAVAQSTPPDVLVIFRRMVDVLSRIPARAKLYWAHDYQGVPFQTQRAGFTRQLAIGWRRLSGPWFHQRVDRIVAISGFLAEVFRWLYHTPADKLAVIPVGIEPGAFATPGPAHSPARFVYASAPDRGLVPLLQDVFPALRASVPQAELHVYSYHRLDAYTRYAAPGIFFHGWVPKAELVRSLQESTLMLYPSSVEEMGCIAVLESMAAGTPAVTSAFGVLPELAGDGSRGVVVEGWPGSSDFTRRFVDVTTTLLADPPRLARMRAAAHDYAITRHSWGAIAAQWEEMLEAMLAATDGGGPTG